jgi:prepilin-type processing-associated H-X9-DG protein
MAGRMRFTPISNRLIFTSAHKRKTSHTPRDAVVSGFTHYWLNTNISGKRDQLLKSPASILIAGDGNDGLDVADARYNRSNVPPAWLNDSRKPFNRHEGGGYFLFADGHVKWFRSGDIINNSSAATKATFTIK